MIAATSRYANNSLVAAKDLDGNDILAIVFTPPTDTTFQYQYHVVTGYDTVDGLAYKIFGDATFWWSIANLNPEIIDFSKLPVGQRIRIPKTNVPL